MIHGVHPFHLMDSAQKLIMTVPVFTTVLIFLQMSAMPAMTAMQTPKTTWLPPIANVSEQSFTTVLTWKQMLAMLAMTAMQARKTIWLPSIANVLAAPLFQAIAPTLYTISLTTMQEKGRVFMQ